jgi:hypothetical protein
MNTERKTPLHVVYSRLNKQQMGIVNLIKERQGISSNSKAIAWILTYIAANKDNETVKGIIG